MHAYPGQTWRSTPQVDCIASQSSLFHADRPVDAFDDARQRTQQPIVTGTSVLGLTYQDGVMLATDTLASYGSLARFMDNQRLTPFGSHVVVGASGDMSDWQNIQHTLTKLMEKEDIQGDGHSLTPEQVYAYLSHTMYERRSKLDPSWNALVLGGYDARANAPVL